MDGSQAGVLAVDFGTSFTCAALDVGGRRELVPLDGADRVPSMVLLAEDGSLVVGREAENQALLRPERLERAPKRWLGDDEVLLGGRPLPVAAMVAAVLEVVRAEALRRLGDRPLDEVWLTHPASWGRRKRDALLDAAGRAGLRPARLVSEPEAAAQYFADRGLRSGQYVAVYDLGGGTFDTAVLQRQDRRFAVVGPPNGREGLGGEVFDQRLFDWVGARLAEDAPELWQRLRDSDERAWRHARGQLRSDVRRAKETLSRDEWAPVYVAHPVDRELRVTRREFEDLIRADVEESVEILRRTIEGAGLQLGDLAGLYLTGGSSRIPLVANLLQAEIGRADTRDDPKTVVALGALEVAAARRPPTSSPPPPPPPPEDPVEPVTVRSPWWRRTPVIVGVLLALLLLGGVTFAAVTQDGDGDGDGEQTQTISERPGTTDTAPPGTTDAPPPETTDGPPAQDDGEPSADEQALSALLPPAAKDCQAGEPAEDATAEFVCDVAGYTVTYTSFPSPTEMDAWFDEGEDPPPGEGGCGGEWPSSGTWHFSATPSGENEGRVKCYDDEEGDSVIEWTEDRHSVHGFMYADGVDHEGLHAAWEERAGLAE